MRSLHAFSSKRIPMKSQPCTPSQFSALRVLEVDRPIMQSANPRRSRQPSCVKRGSGRCSQFWGPGQRTNSTISFHTHGVKEYKISASDESRLSKPTSSKNCSTAHGTQSSRRLPFLTSRGCFALERLERRAPSIRNAGRANPNKLGDLAP